MKRILLLGASGSIGQQTLDVMQKHSDDFVLAGFSVGAQTQQVPQIISQNPSVSSICVGSKEDADTLKRLYPKITFFYGDQGLLDLIEQTPCDLLVNALVGFVGLAPTLKALKRGIDVALANKESLVVGGELIAHVLQAKRARLFPIDSEHVALTKCLENHSVDEVSRLILTASGGSFRTLNREQLKNVTVEDSLKHPSWSMGKKITIDSATMMNKGFEIIEAYYLFNFPLDKIDVILHDESKVHSLVEFKDGSFLADIGPADMRIPITYALYGGKRSGEAPSQLKLSDFGDFHFHPFVPERFPCVGFAKMALKRGGTAPTILNAANEVAVQSFLEGEIPFLAIETIIEKCLANIPSIPLPTFQDIETADQQTRVYGKRIIKEHIV